MNIPEDIVGQIYSYLPLKTIYLLAGQNIINQKLIKNIIKNKYEKMNVKIHQDLLIIFILNVLNVIKI